MKQILPRVAQQQIWAGRRKKISELEDKSIDIIDFKGGGKKEEK